MEIPDWIKYEVAERWERSRDFLNHNPRVVWGIALSSVFVLLLVFISVLSDGRPDIKPAKKAWFYDLNTGKLFAAAADEAGPVEAPSGPLPSGEPAGVRAYVYSYNLEPRREDLVIGYLEKPAPNAVSFTDSTPSYESEGKLVRTVADANWVSVDSVKGRGILRQCSKRNGLGQIPRYNMPE
jgi:hypothetical protein